MLTPDCSTRLLGRGWFKPSLRPGYLLLRSLHCMLLAGFMSIGDTLVKAIRVWAGLYKKLCNFCRNCRWRNWCFLNDSTTLKTYFFILLIWVKSQKEREREKPFTFGRIFFSFFVGSGVVVVTCETIVAHGDSHSANPQGNKVPKGENWNRKKWLAASLLSASSSLVLVLLSVFPQVVGISNR